MLAAAIASRFIPDVQFAVPLDGGVAAGCEANRLAPLGSTKRVVWIVGGGKNPPRADWDKPIDDGEPSLSTLLDELGTARKVLDGRVDGIAGSWKRALALPPELRALWRLEDDPAGILRWLRRRRECGDSVETFRPHVVRLSRSPKGRQVLGAVMVEANGFPSPDNELGVQLEKWIVCELRRGATECQHR